MFFLLAKVTQPAKGLHRSEVHSTPGEMTTKKTPMLAPKKWGRKRKHEHVSYLPAYYQLTYGYESKPWYPGDPK
jgi:hypothetical protein